MVTICKNHFYRYFHDVQILHQQFDYHVCDSIITSAINYHLSNSILNLSFSPMPHKWTYATPSDPTGSYKCHSLGNCLTCQHIADGNTTFNFFNTDKNYDIKQRQDCNSTNVIYALQCKRCLHNGNKNCKYIRKTSRRLKDRFNEHRLDIINKKEDKSGVAEHFCSPAHTINDLAITPLLRLSDKRESVRLAKEQYLIGLANTLTPISMNRTTDC